MVNAVHVLPMASNYIHHGQGNYVCLQEND